MEYATFLKQNWGHKPVFFCWFSLVSAVPKGESACWTTPWLFAAFWYLFSHSNLGTSVGDLNTSEERYTEGKKRRKFWWDAVNKVEMFKIFSFSNGTHHSPVFCCVIQNNSEYVLSECTVSISFAYLCCCYSSFSKQRPYYLIHPSLVFHRGLKTFAAHRGESPRTAQV